MRAFAALVARDIRLAFRAGGGALPALGFFTMVAALVPFGVGAEPALLARIGGGVLWIGAALAALLTLDRLFQSDFEDGSLDVLALSPLSLETTATAKMAAHWLTTGIPLVALSPAAALLFGLAHETLGALALSLLVGTPALSAIGVIAAGLTLSLRRGGLLLSLIVLPLEVPAVIFGARAVMAEGSSDLLFLAAFSLAAVLLAPFASGAAVRLNLAG
ncbi:MAG: heme exporter protein CcmB [Alphaproteobacteria bacterium]